MENRTPASRLFLIGSQASAAMSPGLWGPVLEQLGSSWTYEAWDVPAGQDMSGVRAAMLGADVVAANVTMPHKQWAAGTADTVTEQVRISGASNLLVRHGRRLSAHNTDITAVAELLGGGHQRHALMLGAGGAARAALVALAELADRVTVTDKDPRASRQLLDLATSLGMEAAAVTWAEARDHAADASLIVNATPLGKSSADEPAWGPAGLSPDTFVYDFVYAGHTTATIAAARAQGLPCADGWDHLRAQAVAMIPILGLAPETGALLGRTLADIRTGN
ncbi:shikimate dehydrogenase [Arthrobacter sp. FB24]|uniref:shikimate dehydrogenase family protein n=1 Tax=Arthrobacter sp. (strain FB24) TaxID=290399 RepID=UPI0000526BBD|nr:shikimate dehydrogenase [Arthrobacter sp. FB24]ABK04873.1 shikimate dehydrogenase [Arthrobacter sp. FB24]